MANTLVSKTKNWDSNSHAPAIKKGDSYGCHGFATRGHAVSSMNKTIQSLIKHVDDLAFRGEVWKSGAGIMNYGTWGWRLYIEDLKERE